MGRSTKNGGGLACGAVWGAAGQGRGAGWALQLAWHFGRGSFLQQTALAVLESSVMAVSECDLGNSDT